MGWIGNVFLILGYWLVGDKKRIAFIFTFIGEAFWAIYAIKKGMFDLLFICIVFGLLAVRGWYKWGQENLYFNSMLLPKYQVKWWQIWR